MKIFCSFRSIFVDYLNRALYFLQFYYLISILFHEPHYDFF